jgi:hypothetical protein
MTRQVLLYATDFTAAAEAIEAAGGRLLHVFSPRVFVAALPPEVDPRALPHVSMIPPDDLQETERLLAEGWEALQQQQASSRFTMLAGAPEVALRWDTPGFEPPDADRGEDVAGPMSAIAAADEEGVALSTGTPTSLYLTGKVAVGIVTVSGSPWTSISGALEWVSVGQDGTVWGVNSNDDIFRYQGNDTWQPISGKLKQISVGNANNVWGVNAGNEIFRWTGSGWQQITGSLKNVSVGSDGTVWGCNANDDIFRYQGNNAWQSISGKLKQISVADANTVWGTNGADAIFQWNGGGWTPISGALSVVSAGYDGSVFGVNSANVIFRYLGSNAWQSMPGALAQIDAASTTNLWGVNSADRIFNGNSSSGLQFTQAEIQKVVAEVQEGLNFLASAEPLANITFFYDWRIINVNVTPGPVASISNPYETMEAPWRNAALAAMGFPGSLAGSLAYVNSIKQTFNTDWAYVGFFTKYPLQHFAYQTGERLVMQYANDGWGPDLINQVFAHETGHVFGAADEYGGCGCGVSGFYNINNGNCVNCTSSQAACLMNGNTLTLCGFSRGQIGWSTWTQISGALKWVSVGQDGTTWGVNASDSIFRYQGNNTWQPISGKLKQISVGNANNVWGVNAGGNIFRWTGSAWQQVNGALKNVSVAADGTVWGCNVNDDIFRYLGNNQWQNVGGKLKQISVGSTNIVWGVNSSNKIFKWLGGNNWQQIPGALTCVAAASDGTVWGVNASNNIFRYQVSSNSWVTTSGALKEISVGSTNQVWGVNASDQIYKRRILATP